MRVPPINKDVACGLDLALAYVERCLDSWGEDFELTRGDPVAERRIRAAASWFYQAEQEALKKRQKRARKT